MHVAVIVSGIKSHFLARITGYHSSLYDLSSSLRLGMSIMYQQIRHNATELLNTESQMLLAVSHSDTTIYAVLCDVTIAFYRFLT